jgi:DNA polymerase-3 subunit alpha (Gram-positive type)
MLTLANCEYVVFDVETTGLSPTEGDRVIEFAALKVRGGKITDRLVSLVDPCRALAAQEVHGITEEMLHGAPKSHEVMPKIIEFLGSATLVAHNASFDVKFLANELALAGRKLHEDTPVIDTIKMAKCFLPHLTSYRLEYVARSLGLTIGTTHRAQADAELTVQLFDRLAAMAPDYNVHSLIDLIEKFGVEKPTFRIGRMDLETLF